MTKPRPVQAIESYAVIIRAIHERGQTQAEALAELTRRGLWLTTDQRRQAGLSDREGWTKPAYPGDSVRCARLERDGVLGDVRIQWYGERSFRVAVFCPGVTVELPGDTPKTEPEVSVWAHAPAEADRLFDFVFERQVREGWRVHDVG
jgi:hypothetical protein